MIPTSHPTPTRGRIHAEVVLLEQDTGHSMPVSRRVKTSVIPENTDDPVFPFPQLDPAVTHDASEYTETIFWSFGAKPWIYPT